MNQQKRHRNEKKFIKYNLNTFDILSYIYIYIRIYVGFFKVR